MACGEDLGGLRTSIMVVVELRWMVEGLESLEMAFAAPPPWPSSTNAQMLRRLKPGGTKTTYDLHDMRGHLVRQDQDIVLQDLASNRWYMNNARGGFLAVHFRRSLRRSF